MRRILIVPAAIAAIAVATPAFVAGATEMMPMQQAKATKADCHDLMKQFDDQNSMNSTAPGAAEAKNLRAAGERECKQGNYEAGTRDLHAAIETDVSRLNEDLHPGRR